LTLGARWQPFQNVGEDDPRSPQDEMDVLRSTLARTLGRDGGRQIVAASIPHRGTTVPTTPTEPTPEPQPV
jgi:hypothetical protein